MAVKLHRCSNQWVKMQGHPCWKVEKALQDMGIEYERVPGPLRKSKRDAIAAGTGQRLYRRSSSRTARGTASSRRTWRRRSARAG